MTNRQQRTAISAIKHLHDIVTTSKAHVAHKRLIKWRMRPEIGEDLSVLVSGVDTRQQGQKYY